MAPDHPWTGLSQALRVNVRNKLRKPMPEPPFPMLRGNGYNEAPHLSWEDTQHEVAPDKQLRAERPREPEVSSVKVQEWH